MIKCKLTFEQHDMISDAVWKYAEQFNDLDKRVEELQLLANYDLTAMNELLDMLYLNSISNDMKTVKETIANKANEILCDPNYWDDYVDEVC